MMMMMMSIACLNTSSGVYKNESYRVIVLLYVMTLKHIPGRVLSDPTLAIKAPYNQVARYVLQLVKRLENNLLL